MFHSSEYFILSISDSRPRRKNWHIQKGAESTWYAEYIGRKQDGGHSPDPDATTRISYSKFVKPPSRSGRVEHLLVHGGARTSACGGHGWGRPSSSATTRRTLPSSSAPVPTHRRPSIEEAEGRAYCSGSQRDLDSDLDLDMHL
jgi:hypothetical protein